MQSQRVHLTRNVLANNLEQISKVFLALKGQVKKIKIDFTYFNFPLQISDSLETLSSLIESNKADNVVNDKISSIVGECNNLESCILDQNQAIP